MNKIIEVVPASVLIAIGATAIVVVIWLFKMFSNNVNEQMKQAFRIQQEEIRRENLEGRKEREYDNYILLRGMQVMSELDHELVYCVMNGTHNGGLETANKNLDEFRKLSNENLLNKASKWNLKIDS